MAIRLTDQPNAACAESRDPRGAAKSRLKTRRLRRAWITSCLGVVVLGSSGCGLISNGVQSAVKDVHECVDDSMAAYRNRALAEKAWIRIRHQYVHHQYHRDFKKGFVAGYMEVSDGGNGCCPSIAPSEYWGWKYQSPYGQAAVNAWFEGYPLGAKAAEQDGVGFWGNIQMKLKTPQEPGYGYTDQPVGSGMPVPDEPVPYEVIPYESEESLVEPLSEPLPAPSLSDPEALEFPPGETSEGELQITDPGSALIPVPGSGRSFQGMIKEPQIVAGSEVTTGPIPSTQAGGLTSGTDSPGSSPFVNGSFGTPVNVEPVEDSEQLSYSFE